MTRWRPTVGGGRLGNTRLTPVVIALIAVNVVVYIWEQTQHAGIYVFQGTASPCPNIGICRYGLWPYAVHHGQLYRIITSAFLHENIEHIALNMITLAIGKGAEAIARNITLAIVGPPVEAELGRVRFIALYLVCALGGSVGSYLLSPQDELGLGASGAIFGLMGAYFILARRRGWDTTTILALIVINLLFGFTGGIDWRDHLGGLVTGASVSLGMAHSVDLRRAASRTAEVATGVATTLAALGVLGLLLLLPPGHVNL